ncbi:MAG: TIGR03960 family B12-binding radical SAM protein [Proteobacteria bacterium]|nr:TIGR03960 family B12-binding radical SAM protein [Desulfobulbaceae bacterium]MBU4151395.1 TIGR03960 family B12-binding radical SAM protein [Pseudomonadota bacterium]
MRDAVLPLVVKPSRYCGNEYNVVQKEWQSVSLRIVLAFPDLYEIGMSHHGLQILYHIINGRSEFLAERVYAPDRDLEEVLRKLDKPLFALESGRPLAEFDIVGITLPYELCYSNILTILDLAEIPLYSRDRKDDHPLIIGGGPCAFHPEPVADFFDAILLGDGEEAILAIADLVRAGKEKGLGRREILQFMCRIPGMYVPSLFEPHYHEDGRLSAITPLLPEYQSVRRAVIADLNQQPIIDKPLVPLNRIVHDRLGLELARGCTRGCRFCQAGMIYRPVRELHPDQAMERACRGIASSGFDELALLSLSTGDYSCLAPLLVRLMDHFAKQRVSVSMPSMRVGTLTPEIMEQVKRVRKTGFTIAPEAGSDRLRRVINKGITEDDLLQTVQSAFGLGWKLIKLYFMYGLPFETEEDLAAIPTLVAKAMHLAGRSGRTINVSAGTFVPKPHTPFQWEPQLGIDEANQKTDFLRRTLPRNAKLKWNDVKLSFLEGVFSRGDRRLSALIERAWRMGARLDAWSEHFQLALWRQAAEECSLDLSWYLRRRGRDEILPWQHLDAGIDADFLTRELDKAKDEAYTPDCRYHGCQQCGLCDFKTIRPVVFSPSELSPPSIHNECEEPLRGQGSFYYWIEYQRHEQARFLGHLELLQVIFRVLKRAGMPVLFSQGFSPSPKVSFSPALSVGTESLAEYCIVETGAPLQDLEDWRQRLMAQTPPGLSVTSLSLGAKTPPAQIAVDYRITLAKPYPADSVDNFCASDHYPISVVRKGKKRELDARPIVAGMCMVDPSTVEMTMMVEAAKVGVKPQELMVKLFGIEADEIPQTRILKLAWRALS